MINTEEAKKMIDADKSERVTKCSALIEQALKECRCQMTTILQITPDGRIVASVQLTAQE